MDTTLAPVVFSLDIGHSSIGWAALERQSPHPLVLGTGTVIFRTDDCLNKNRAGFRRQRRNIAARRNRIKRLKGYLLHLGVLSEDQLRGGKKADEPEMGHRAPWLLAARVLSGHPKGKLSWEELWHVIRWYAHNRGYDGNAEWADVETDEDTEKVENAKKLMEEFHKGSMAETISAFLEVDLNDDKPQPTKYFKGNNVAFPRETVVSEVERILEAHEGVLPKVDFIFIETLLKDWKVAKVPTIKLPGRYRGGLLFGQNIPRFNNRIIPLCLITGMKTPAKNCREYFLFRWGMLVNNIRVKGVDGTTRPLTAPERKLLHAEMEAVGAMTKARELKPAVEKITGCNCDQLDALFFSEETEKALVLDPVRKKMNSDVYKDIWDAVPEKFQRVFSRQLLSGKKVLLPNGKKRAPTLEYWRHYLQDRGVSTVVLEKALKTGFEKAKKNKRGKDKDSYSYEDFVSSAITPDGIPSGRARYCRELLKKAFDEVMEGRDPRGDDPVHGPGCICETKEVKLRLAERDLDSLTNNHLVRHRIKIVERLVHDLVDKYAGGDRRKVDAVVVETAKDLVEYSGMSAKEKASLFGAKQADHKKAVRQLEALQAEGLKFKITGGLIRKFRIAQDLDFTCPFTGKKYSPESIINGDGANGNLELEHIIPYSDRPSNSLDSLVLTWSSVNRLKGKRSGYQFVQEFESQTVPGTNLMVSTSKLYEKLVGGLDTRKGSDDDKKRKAKRAQLLLTPSYDPRQGEFLGKDLTQTSHINKLAALRIHQALRDGDELVKVISVPGSATAKFRKEWHLIDLLGGVIPEVIAEDGSIMAKGDIRDITHLHHAVDALTLGLIYTYVPRKLQISRLWELLSRRNLRPEEISELTIMNLFHFHEGKAMLDDIPPALYTNIQEKLAEKRVVMHLPKKIEGLKVEQTTWGVRRYDPETGKALIAQKDARVPGQATRTTRRKEEKATKLLGFRPGVEDGKLQKIKGAFIVSDNYGVALDPEPVVLPYINVWKRLQEITALNGGKRPRVLRNGMVIDVPRGRYEGTWRVFSVMDKSKGIMLKIGPLDAISFNEKSPNHKIAILNTLLSMGLNINASKLLA